MNKNQTLVIILVAILAFLISYIFIHNSNKKVNEKLKPSNVQEENISKDNINNEQEDVLKLTEEEKKLPQLDPIPENVAKREMQRIRESINKTTNIKQNNQTEVDNSKTSNENDLTNKPTVLEKEVIVPVSYKTDSTYKYVYTPSRFNKDN